MMKTISILLLLVSISFHFASGQEKLAILPLGGVDVENSTKETVYRLLTSEISQLKKYDLVPESEISPLVGERGCLDAACAIEIGRQVHASKVVFGSLNKLGEKIIFQYNLADVIAGQTLLSDDLSAVRVEDLDQVTKRVAASIVQQTPAEKTVEVGLVTEQESQEPRERKANSSVGIAFGYLYPSKGYNDLDPIFVWDFRSLYEMRHVAVDAVLGIRKGFALNVGCLYLMSLRDFSPFAGAGIGFHNVDHEYKYGDTYSHDNRDEKGSDGFEFLFKAGIMAFRTYDFRVIVTGEYSITLNDYDDHAAVVTIGVMRSGKRVFGIF
jgi:hypothetical protein